MPGLLDYLYPKGWGGGLLGYGNAAADQVGIDQERAGLLSQGLPGQAIMHKPMDNPMGFAMGTSNVGGKLPMDNASRMARAADAGFGRELYHATPYDIQQFVPSKWRGATYLADSPEGARRGAVAGAQEHPALGGPTGDAPLADGWNIMPVRARGKIFGQDPLPNDWLPESMTYGQWRQERTGGWKDWNPPNSENLTARQKELARFYRHEVLGNYSEAVPESEFYKYSGATEGDLPLKRGSMIPKDISYESFEGIGDGSAFQEELRGLIQKLGYSGAKVSDESGAATAIFDPKNIRSRFAAFDPSKKDSSDILAGIAGALGLTGLLGAQEGEQTQ